MASLSASDVQIPANWNSYLYELSVVNTDFVKSGVISTFDGTDITKGGSSINLPYFGDLDETDEVLASATALTPNGVSTFKSVAPIMARGRALGINVLAPAYAGDDPTGFLAGRWGNYWERAQQRILISELKGVTNASTMANAVSDISGTASNVLSVNSFIDAEYLLGDARSKLAAVVMHSSVKAKLEKLDLLDTAIAGSQKTFQNTYRGKLIIENDLLVPTAGVYDMYFLAEGAFGYAENLSIGSVQLQDDILKGDTYMTSRRFFTLAPRGVSYAGTLGESHPTNAELATGTNWTRVANQKNVGIVRHSFKLA